MSSTLTLNQRDRYGDFYQGWRRLREVFRFDVRYRCRRLQAVLHELGIETAGKQVLDVGFGNGALLASFPTSCTLTGVDISESAVEAARDDGRFATYAGARFEVNDGLEPEDLPAGPFDVVVSSHVLEHVPDDHASLRAMHGRLRPGGIVAIFVPIEEPDYISFHVRNYSLQSIVERVQRGGFRVRHVEGSMCVNGHVWKVLTIPSRRRWPLVGPLVDATRLSTLSSLPYPVLRAVDQGLYALGFGPRQALVVAERMA